MAINVFPRPRLDELAAELAGELITPDSSGYDSARRVWNGMIDKRPVAIVVCADSDDVASAIRFATAQELPLSIRGGGHNVAGTAIAEEGVVVDLSAMRAVRVDPVAANPRRLGHRRPRHRTPCRPGRPAPTGQARPRP